jgi:hypothetical protein
VDQRLTRRLLDQRPKKRNTDRMVTSAIGLIADDSPLTVTLGNSTVAAVKASGYTATIGDRVYVLLSGDDPPFIVDKIT